MEKFAKQYLLDAHVPKDPRENPPKKQITAIEKIEINGSNAYRTQCISFDIIYCGQDLRKFIPDHSKEIKEIINKTSFISKNCGVDKFADFFDALASKFHDSKIFVEEFSIYVTIKYIIDNPYYEEEMRQFNDRIEKYEKDIRKFYEDRKRYLAAEMAALEKRKEKYIKECVLRAEEEKDRIAFEIEKLGEISNVFSK